MPLKVFFCCSDRSKWDFPNPLNWGMSEYIYSICTTTNQHFSQKRKCCLHPFLSPSPSTLELLQASILISMC